MLEGAIARIPAPDYWDLFRQAENQHPTLIAELADVIRLYAASLSEVNSTAAGAAILPTWARRNDWDRLFSGSSSQLFGMVLWVALFDDTASWRVSSETVAGRQARIYRRA